MSGGQQACVPCPGQGPLFVAGQSFRMELSIDAYSSERFWRSSLLSYVTYVTYVARRFALDGHLFQPAWGLNQDRGASRLNESFFSEPSENTRDRFSGASNHVG